MDIATVLGLSIALGALAAGVIMEGGNLGSFVNPPAAVIVFGGSLGALLVCMPLTQVITLPIVMLKAFFTKGHDLLATRERLIELATKARREGVLSLEEELESITDDFLRKGLQLVIDGSDQAVVEQILATELEAQENRHKRGAQVFMTLGALAPTLGITGTVMGLVHMMGKANDPESMGPAIAGAFMATLYGVASANVIFIPVGTKLKVRSEQEQAAREMILEGILALQEGQSPFAIGERLGAFLEPKRKKQATEQAKAA